MWSVRFSVLLSGETHVARWQGLYGENGSANGQAVAHKASLSQGRYVFHDFFIAGVVGYYFQSHQVSHILGAAFSDFFLKSYKSFRIFWLSCRSVAQGEILQSVNPNFSIKLQICSYFCFICFKALNDNKMYPFIGSINSSIEDSFIDWHPSNEWLFLTSLLLPFQKYRILPVLPCVLIIGLALKRSQSHLPSIIPFCFCDAKYVYPVVLHFISNMVCAFSVLYLDSTF